MQVPGPFEYERATSVDHAVGLLDRLGEDARIVAGGHSLLPMMKLRIANPEYLVDINDLADALGYIEVAANTVRIGAMARHRAVLDSDPLATVCIVGTAGALGDAGSPASDSTLGPTSGLNVDGQHHHIWDTVVPTFLHYNIPLLAFGWLAAMIL